MRTILLMAALLFECSGYVPAEATKQPPPSIRAGEDGGAATEPETVDARSRCASAPARTRREEALGERAAGDGPLMAPGFGGAFGFFAVDGEAVGPGTLHSDPVALELSGPAALVAGQPLSLEIVARNRTPQPQTLMRALDGSVEHWRTAHWDLMARDGAGAVHRWDFHGGRCGNVNAIGPNDYVTLGPGEAQSDIPGPWGDQLTIATLPAGRYEVWVVYRFCGFDGRSLLPLAVDQRRDDVTIGVVASNALKVEVRDEARPGTVAP